MNEQSLYVFPPIIDTIFPVYIEKQHYHKPGEIFRAHWHEHIEFIFMVEGELTLTCNGKTISAQKEDLLVINGNDIHHLQTQTRNVAYYCIVFDPMLLRNSLLDRGDLDFIIPLSNNYIVLKNKVSHNPQIITCLNNLIREYEAKEPAYELAVKSHLYHMLTLIFRNCIDTVLSDHTYKRRRNNLRLIQSILEFIHENFTQDIHLLELAQQFNISYYYLCHIFKDFTDKTLVQYITTLRINKAIFYLEHTDKSISEIALLVGYNDTNYFSRVFKKEQKYAPSKTKRYL